MGDLLTGSPMNSPAACGGTFEIWTRITRKTLIFAL